MTPPDGPAPEAVYDLLYQLGLCAKSTAFFHLAYTVRLAAEQPQRLLAAAWLYPETGRHYSVSPETVERSIRHIGMLAWRLAPDRLSLLAGVPLTEPPPAIRFVAILAAAVRERYAA